MDSANNAARGAPRPEAASDAAADPRRQATAVLERLRRDQPRVHAVTSPVAAELTANVLLALGAQPSLTADPAEIEPFVHGCGAVLLNLGMLDGPRRESLPAALALARRLGKPIVLDPVYIEASPGRAALARALADPPVTVVKLNRAEAAVGGLGLGEVVCVTGATDMVMSADRRLTLLNGHPLMARVTAMGCAAGAVIAAALAVERDGFAAAAAALAIMGVAGEMAGETARGPGSFAVAMLDALAALDADDLAARLIWR